jgi:hypothetical protein
MPINSLVIVFIKETITISAVFPAKAGNQFKEFLDAGTRTL